MKNVLPQDFEEAMTATLGREEADALISALTSTPPEVSVRLNRRKPMTMNGERVAWCDEGRYLDLRPQFTLDPALHQGRYYVQDASSMFISHVIRQLTRDATASPLYLDGCAAPGGKTTAAIDALPERSVVIANEFVPARAAVLRENVTKWGYPHVIVTRSDTAALAKALAGRVDIVAADVPCSGEGMVRKDAEARAQWSPRLVAECVARQREIVDNLWKTLKPGGYLIYSTCTFNLDENERMVEYLTGELGGESVRIDITGLPGIATQITGEAWCYRFMPHRTRGEGLTMAVIRKPASSDDRKTSHEHSGRSSRGKKQTKCQALPSNWLNDPQLELTVEEDRVNAVAPELKGPLEALRRHKVDVIAHGVSVATVKGRDMVPSQGLAMSTALRPEAFVRVEIDRETALDYLRRQAITLPDGTPRGYTLLTYDSIPLGFVKNIGNRANNLYPAPWRILH
jgi:tRNA and rRNA cytosine-C5-methylases